VSDIVIPEDAVEAATTTHYTEWERDPKATDTDVMRAALVAALPALRRQWAEEVAQAVLDRGTARPDSAWRATRTAARIVRQFGESLPIAECEEGK
jgi:hypothetical protein